MKFKLSLMIISLAVLFCGCSNNNSNSAYPLIDDWPRVDIGNVSDKQLTAQMGKKIGDLFEAKKLISLKELYKGIDNKSCQVITKEPANSEMNLPDLYQKCKKSIVIIVKIYKCDSCNNWHTTTAGGFVANEDGTVVTNYHVVNDQKSATMAAITSDGRIWAITEILAADKANDLAVIKTDIRGVKPLPIRVGKDVGSDAIVISHPQKHFYTLTTGVISRYALSNSKDGKIRQMEISADYAKGSSGCPILDNTGAVIGLVASTSSIYYNKNDDIEENFQMAIKNCATADAIKNLTDGY